MNEFALIQDFFKSIPLKSKDVILGIGDDCACLNIPTNMKLLISTDTLVSGVHFLPEWEAYNIASKAVRVNVSDIAAMAAEPRWVTLALTLPRFDAQWLESFSKGLRDSLQEFNVDLVGGDTARGPLSMTLTILGVASEKSIVKRSGAKPGDIIFVSGPLGGAALAVTCLEDTAISAEDRMVLAHKLHFPKPRLDLRSYLMEYASAAIDISDGLSADLNHICQASGVGATLHIETIPLHPLLSVHAKNKAFDLALSGGDDYELCFTVPTDKILLFNQAMKEAGLVCYAVGHIEEQCGLRILKADGSSETMTPKGYTHF